VARLRDQLARSEADRVRGERERARLERAHARLKDELEAARRAGARQAAPFSKGVPNRRPRRPGRTPGAAYGRRGRRPIPTRVHETHDVPVPTQCRSGGLPPVQPVVRRFDVHIGRCTGCHRRVQGRPPLQISDALGAAGVQLGPHAVALAVPLNKQFGVSFGKIAARFRDRFGLHVTASAIVRALHRVARKGQPTCDALCETVRTSAGVGPDETGWKVRGVLHGLWVFATAMTPG
jgi:transposase